MDYLFEAEFEGCGVGNGVNLLRRVEPDFAGFWFSCTRDVEGLSKSTRDVGSLAAEAEDYVNCVLVVVVFGDGIMGQDDGFAPGHHELIC